MKPWEEFQQASNDQPAAQDGPWNDFHEDTSSAPAAKPHSQLSLKEKLVNLAGAFAVPFDYAGGLVRTGVGDAIAPADAVTSKDWMNALKGDAPSSDEIMKRSGIPQGKHLSDLIPGAYSPTGEEWLKLQKGGMLDPSARGTAGFAMDVAADPLTYVSFGGSAALKNGGKFKQALEKAINPASHLMESGGETMYKSGLKRIDQEVAKFGKEPVSDVLMKYNIAGSAKSIANQMDELGQRLLAERNQVLQRATDQGGQVSMREAMAPTLQKVAEMRQSRDPGLQKLADALEAKANEYIALDFKPAYSEVKIHPKEQNLLELPRQGEMAGGFSEVQYVPKQAETVSLPKQAGYDQSGWKMLDPEVGYVETPARFEPGKTIPDQFVPNKPAVGFYETPAWTEAGKTVAAVPGPSPMQASGYKSTLYSALGDNAFKDRGMYDKVKSAEKAFAGGVRNATEQSVEKTLGKDAAQELITKNDELGRILTSEEKQLLEAQKEQSKNLFTSVDGMILGDGNPKMLLMKKLADAAKLAAPRTYVGRTLYNQGRGQLTGPMWDVLMRQGIINGANRPEDLPAVPLRSPWEDQ